MTKFEDYTVQELHEKARKKGLVRYSRLHKVNLISLLRGNKKSPKKSPKKSLTFSKSLWFLFTKDGCGFCQKAKDLLTKNNIKYKIQEITPDNKESWYSKIDIYTNKYRYFPIIFKKGTFIGGYIDLEKLVT